MEQVVELIWLFIDGEKVNFPTPFMCAHFDVTRHRGAAWNRRPAGRREAAGAVARASAVRSVLLRRHCEAMTLAKAEAFPAHTHGAAKNQTSRATRAH
jgi:hypothetical protein